jgi:hypothetical protein
MIGILLLIKIIDKSILLLEGLEVKEQNFLTRLNGLSCDTEKCMYI